MEVEGRAILTAVTIASPAATTAQRGMSSDDGRCAMSTSEGQLPLPPSPVSTAMSRQVRRSSTVSMRLLLSSMRPAGTASRGSVKSATLKAYWNLQARMGGTLLGLCASPSDLLRKRIGHGQPRRFASAGATDWGMVMRKMLEKKLADPMKTTKDAPRSVLPMSALGMDVRGSVPKTRTIARKAARAVPPNRSVPLPIASPAVLSSTAATVITTHIVSLHARSGGVRTCSCRWVHASGPSRTRETTC